MDNSEVCKHKSLRRNCELCEKDETIERLELRIAQLIHERDEITKRRNELVEPYEKMREKLQDMANQGFHIDL